MDSYFLRYNERVKAISGTLMNLGAGLLAISIGRLILNQDDFVGFFWLLGSFVLFVGGIWSLSWLESEV